MVLTGLVAGCTFSTQTPGPDDPTGLCPFDFTPATIDPCKEESPRSLDQLPDVTITDPTAAIDTGNGDIVAPNVFTPPPTTVIDGVRVVWTRTFTITAGASLRAYGDMPLAIIATSAIRIEGTIDASSTATTKGAGGNSPACGASTGKPGLQCAQHGGSGGGGGGFGAPGAPGGEGGDTHDCGGAATSGQPGGMAGIATGVPTKIRGGCGGGDGQPSNDPAGVIGVGGAGGGGVALIARDKVLVTGTIHAGGGGGQKGLERAGGGGGGSGGFLFLESVDVDLQATSIVAANGGGGAGGCDGTNTHEAGETGLPLIDNDADGGDGDGAGGNGGDGGFAATAATAGALSTRGGGGGGGGVGVIRVHAKTGSQAGKASPAITN